MNTLFLVLNDLSKVDDVMEVFYEEGIGATMLESEGLGRVLLDHDEEIPLFSSMRKMIEGNKPYNKTFISTIRDEILLNRIIKKIIAVTDLEDRPGVGFMFVIPTIRAYQYTPED